MGDTRHTECPGTPGSRGVGFVYRRGKGTPFELGAGSLVYATHSGKVGSRMEFVGGGSLGSLDTA